MADYMSDDERWWADQGGYDEADERRKQQQPFGGPMTTQDQRRSVEYSGAPGKGFLDRANAEGQYGIYDANSRKLNFVDGQQDGAMWIPAGKHDQLEYWSGLVNGGGQGAVKTPQQSVAGWTWTPSDNTSRYTEGGFYQDSGGNQRSISEMIDMGLIQGEANPDWMDAAIMSGSLKPGWYNAVSGGYDSFQRHGAPTAEFLKSIMPEQYWGNGQPMPDTQNGNLMMPNGDIMDWRNGEYVLSDHRQDGTMQPGTYGNDPNNIDSSGGLSTINGSIGASVGGTGGNTSSAGGQVVGNDRRNQLYEMLLGRATQGLNADRNSPGVRGQADAFAAAQERARRNYISDTAERGGPLANIQGERRMAAERMGQNVGSFESELIGREVAARRDEIQNALIQMGSLLTEDQRIALQQEMMQMDALLRSRGLDLSGRELDIRERLGEGALGIDQQQLGLQERLGQGGLNNELMRIILGNEQFQAGLNSENDQFLAQLGFNEADRARYWDLLERGLLGG